MKSMQKFVAALLGTALCAVLLATAAFAQGGVAVTLPVSIRTAGADPEPNAAYTLCLQAVDNAPMPDGARNGQYSVTVQGAGDYTFTSILQPDDVDAVQNSGYPLVLYSCTYSGSGPGCPYGLDSKMEWSKIIALKRLFLVLQNLHKHSISENSCQLSKSFKYF